MNQQVLIALKRVSNFGGMVGGGVSRSSATQHVAGSIPARCKYVYDLQVVVPSLGVLVCECRCL